MGKFYLIFPLLVISLPLPYIQQIFGKFCTIVAVGLQYSHISCQLIFITSFQSCDDFKQALISSTSELLAMFVENHQPELRLNRP
jgi:hypothetical protein